MRGMYSTILTMKRARKQLPDGPENGATFFYQKHYFPEPIQCLTLKSRHY